MVSDVEKNSNETYDVLDGKANDTTTRPVIEGKVQVMKSELASYYKSGLKDMGYTSEEIKDMGEIYVIKTMSATTSRIMTIIGLLAFIAAIVVIIVIMVFSFCFSFSNFFLFVCSKFFFFFFHIF